MRSVPARVGWGWRFGAALALLAGPALGQTRIDGMEHLFGASNTNAVAGHGGLTVGVGAEGDVSVLSWPSPSYYDQLAYVSSNALDARSKPHMGALDGMGSYVGLLIDSGGGPTLSWFRDSAWTHAQAYAADDAPIPVTTFTRSDLGLTVTLTDIVSPDVDVLTRRVQVVRAPASPVTSVSLVVYENLSPSLSRIPQLPVADWALDSRNDYLAAWDAPDGAIVHFHPGDSGVVTSILGAAADPTLIDYGAVEALMKQAAPPSADVDQLVANLDTDYQPGVAALVTTEPAPTSFQVGSDATPICAAVNALADNILKLPSEFPGTALPVDPGIANALKCTDALDAIRTAHAWQNRPADALADLADGTLSGDRVAAAQTNGALIAPLSFGADAAEGSLLIAFGHDLAEARTALGTVKQASAAEREKAAMDAASSALDNARLPDPALGDKIRKVALRALVNVYVARDRQSGAIVASVTRQPPYYLDWPRDGAFFDAALDVAGLTDWATQRIEWYAGLARTDPTKGSPLLTPNVTVDPDTGAAEFPADAWEMNYFADGEVGGPIRFEIDNTGLHLWSIALHAATLDGSARKDFLDAVWPSTRRSLDLLARWKEDDKLPAPANEDDHLELTSELQGATAVYAAMEAGARLARAVGDDASMKRYEARRAELATAIIGTYYVADKQLFTDIRANRDPNPGLGTVAWAIWPSRVLPPGDPRIEHQLDADMDAVTSILEGNAEGGSYVAKNIVAAALYGKDGGARDKARHALDLLADAATPDTQQFGETYVVVSQDPLVWSNRVAPPHVWQGILFYLSAMALSEPARFDADQSALPYPKSSAQPGDATGGGGCACRVGRGDHAPAGLAVLLSSLILGMSVRRGRRRDRLGSRGGSTPRSLLRNCSRRRLRRARSARFARAQ